MMSKRQNHRDCDRCPDRRDCAESVRRGGVALCERDIWLPVHRGPDWRQDALGRRPIRWMRV